MMPTLPTALPKRALSAIAAAAAALAVLLAAAGVARASHYAIADVPRLITPAQVASLHKVGVETTAQLLERAAKPKDRKALAKASGLSPTELTDLARRCDLLRIKGVGSEMVLLLEAAGVKTTAELAKRDAPGLTEAALSANKTKKITEKPPTEPQLSDWIEQAKKLPQILDAK
jgi:predicted flap endonuclease-1-like 5' DNA nuclease